MSTDLTFFTNEPEGELEKDQTVRKFRIVQFEGERKVSRNLHHFNLDVIISVGYRIKSVVGTQFRIWATNVLKEHLVQGFTIREERLKTQAQKYQELKNSVKLLENILALDEIMTASKNTTEQTGGLVVPGRPINLSEDIRFAPHIQFLEYHRENVF